MIKENKVTLIVFIVGSIVVNLLINNLLFTVGSVAGLFVFYFFVRPYLDGIE